MVSLLLNETKLVKHNISSNDNIPLGENGQFHDNCHSSDTHVLSAHSAHQGSTVGFALVKSKA